MTHFTAQLKDLDITPRVYQKLFLQLQKWRALAHLFIPPPDVDVTTAGEDITTSTAPNEMVDVNHQFGPQQTPSPHQTLTLPVAPVVSSNLENDINSSGDSSDSDSSDSSSDNDDKQ